MKLSEAKAKAESAQSGIPDVYADREQIKAQNVYKEFINDAPVILIIKPKVKKENGQWVRSMSRQGNPIFKKTAFIPIEMEGKKYIVVTTEEKTVNILIEVIGRKTEPVVLKDAADACDRTLQFSAAEPIEGRLRFVREPKKYANGEIHDVCVLDSVEI